jgi:hypothetical protein
MKLFIISTTTLQERRAWMNTDASRVTRVSTYANYTLLKLFHRTHNKIFKM